MKTTSKLVAHIGVAAILLANLLSPVLADRVYPQGEVIRIDETYVDDWGFPVEVQLTGQAIYSYHLNGPIRVYNLSNVRMTVTNLDNGKTASLVSVGMVYGVYDGSDFTYTLIGNTMLKDGKGTTVNAGVTLQIGLFDPMIVKIAGTTSTGDDVFSALVAALQ